MQDVQIKKNQRARVVRAGVEVVVVVVVVVVVMVVEEEFT